MEKFPGIAAQSPSIISFRAPRRRLAFIRARHVVAALALSGQASAFAQSLVDNDNFVVSASRTLKAAQDVAAQVSIINRQDIIDSGAATLIDLLQRRANLDVRATGGPGQSSGIFMRGTSATHTLILIDGQRVASSTTGATALEHIALDLIERIEVVRGPLSALYGADAIGGVIQIFTRKGLRSAEDGITRTSASAGMGSFSARNLDAGVAGKIGETTLLLNMSQRRVDAPSASNPAAGGFIYNPDRDPFENTSAIVKLSHQLWQGETVSVTAWQSRGKVRFDSGLGNDAVNDQTLSGLQLGSENNITSWWRSRLSLGTTSDDSKVTSNFSSTFKTSQQQFSWQHQLTTATGELLLGFERRAEKVDATTDYTAKTRTTDALFGSISQRVDAQTLSINARRDKESQFGERSTGGVSWTYQLWKDELVYLSAGKAFRAPSFNDLYFPGFSNPLLRPERSESGEFGWRLNRPNFLLNLAVFENRIDDLIAFDIVTFQPQNIRRARIRGWELGIDTKWAGVDWRTRMTAQQPVDADTNKQLRSRAKLLGSVGASTTLGAWKFGGDVTASGARFDSANEAPTSRMAGYALIGAFAHYRIDRQWTLELNGNNLGDRKYTLARGYNTLGRQLLLNIRFTSQ